jgi:hypothetical protein
MASFDPKRKGPSFIDVLALAESRNPGDPEKPSATTKLAQLLARAHREEDPGKRPILVKLPLKQGQ